MQRRHIADRDCLHIRRVTANLLRNGWHTQAGVCVEEYQPLTSRIQHLKKYRQQTWPVALKRSKHIKMRDRRLPPRLELNSTVFWVIARCNLV
jgi:hypothetical protein